MNSSFSSGLQFVVLHHQDIDEPHFDLMFELVTGQKLRTFRARDWPIVQPQPVESLGDHRREYLEYEGAVSGNRGTVTRVLRGRLQIKAAGEDALNLLLVAESGPTVHLVFVRKPGENWFVRRVTSGADGPQR